MNNIMLTLRTLLIVGLIPFTATAGENPATAAVNHLGLALLRQSEGNTLISPWSLQQSLAMVYAGARGKTKDEMAAALGYSGDTTTLHEGFKQLREAGNALVSVVEGITPLRSANQLFIAECSTLPKTEVRLWLPRLKMEPPSRPMKSALQKLGMKAAFSDKDADLTGIWQSSNEQNPVIDEVFHRTFIELDENGTKAAASTAVIIRPKNGVPHEVPHVNVRCDHPFLFAIQHVPTGACLFIGRVTDPAPNASENVAPRMFKN